MTERSDEIIRAIPKAHSSVSQWDPTHRYIVTRTTLTVQEVLYGNIKIDDEIVVETLGGYVEADKIRMYVPGAPVFQQDEEVVLYLWRHGDTLRTLDLSAGKFEIHTNENGDRVVTRRDLAHVNVVAGKLTIVSTLNELRTKIMEAVERKIARQKAPKVGQAANAPQQNAVPTVTPDEKRQDRVDKVSSKKAENVGTKP